MLIHQVTEAHKRHEIPPHSIFAVDRLVHRAVSEVLSIIYHQVYGVNYIYVAMIYSNYKSKYA